MSPADAGAAFPWPDPPPLGGEASGRAILPDTLVAGDQRAYELLFEAYLDPLCRFVYRYVGAWDVAEDLVQDVFHGVWRRLREVPELPAIRNYLYAAARNHAIKHLRHQGVEARHRDRTMVGGAGSAAAAPEGQDHAEADELAAAIQRAVDDLPPRQRQALLLRWRGQLTHAEIAAAMGLAPNTVQVHLQRALNRLRDLLPEYLPDLR